MIILFSSARNLVTLFGSTQDVILDNSALYLRFTAPFYAVLGILFNMRNSLQALGEKTKPLISSFIECAGKSSSPCYHPDDGLLGCHHLRTTDLVFHDCAAGLLLSACAVS